MAYSGLAQDASQLYPYGNSGRQRVKTVSVMAESYFSLQHVSR